MTLNCNEQFFHVCSVFQPTMEVDCSATGSNQTFYSQVKLCFSDSIHLDPDNLLPTDIRSKFQCLNKDFDYVFDPNFGCYNGAFGDFQAIINMGLIPPPQCKGCRPQYSCNMLVDLQKKFDE